ncbi:hypothetical protein QSV34_05080 [Porticoccus sp. W117]|uniref:hypothetical protein n=1 Tax=Porticoccus sp. W117 TaxID=3054777 RepID=UPI00259A6FB3|nr:hypothetical protein [Porticoccus sp. W117]MDM3870721.1 hypothetical protein [Porticoccus sp. W117]
MNLKLGVFVIGFVLSFSVFSDESETSGLTHYEQITLKLLLSDNIENLRLGLRNVIYNHADRRSLQDVVAHIFTEYETGGRVFHKDTFALILRALGESRSKRYAQLIQSAVDHKESKVQKYARKAVRKLKRSDPAFVASAGWRDMAQSLVLSSGGEKSGRLSDIQRDTHVNDVASKLGVPDRVGVTFLSKHKPFVGTIRHPFLTLIYEDRGRVVFNWLRSEWLVHRVEPSRHAEKSAGEFAKDIQSGSGHYLRVLARQMYEARENDPEKIALIIDRIRRDIHTKDRNLVDAFSWFCKTIGRTEEEGYRNFLLEVADKASSAKLRRHAKSSIKLIGATR